MTRLRQVVFRINGLPVVPLGLGQLIAGARISSGMTQKELADAVSKPKTWVVDLERGRARTELSDLRKCCDVLAVPPADAMLSLISTSLAPMTDFGVSSDAVMEGIIAAWKAMTAPSP